MTVKQYWNLIDREPFLAITWESDFSQECSFCKMLMNHKNFNFTQIPDKTNDEIFLKSPKAMFLGHFWPFLVIFARWRFFPKDTALPHKTIYGPPTHVKFQKKLISQSRENLRTDRLYFTAPFRPRPGVQQDTGMRTWNFISELIKNQEHKMSRAILNFTRNFRMKGPHYFCS